MGLFSFFRANSQAKPGLVVLSARTGLKDVFDVPEPTKSLLWVTDKDVSEMQSPLSMRLTISLSDSGVSSELKDGHNLYGEPSMIWTMLPVSPNDSLETKPMYYPSSSGFSPGHRYQYLMWLRDVTQQTNLSYVFLYYYGLERHLLVGDFDGAAAETVRLLKHHDRGTFHTYAQSALIVAALHHKREDVFAQYPGILDGISNETLAMRKHLRLPIKARELMGLAGAARFSNRRYIRECPDDFARELDACLLDYEARRGPLLDVVPDDNLQYKEAVVFANMSLPTSVRSIPVPSIIPDDRFKAAVHQVLSSAHENLKRSRSKRDT